MNSRSFVLAAVIAGAAMGLLGNLPLLNLINCVLCLWVWLGGAMAVILYSRLQGGRAALTGGQAAGLGAVSGLIGAVIGLGVYLVTAAISAPIFESLARALDMQGDLPFAVGAGQTMAGALIFLVIDLVLYPGFGALGALITANMRNKATPGAQTPTA